MKKTLKLLLCKTFYYTGLFYLVRSIQFLSGKRLTILTFHRVAEDVCGLQVGGLPTISISRQNFDALLKFVAKHYNVIGLQEYLDFVQAGSQPNQHCLLLSFDDGYREVMEIAQPILEKYNLPAVLFVPTTAVDQGNFFWWDGVYELLVTPDFNDTLVRVDRNGWRPEVMRLYEQIIDSTGPERRQLIFDLIEVLQDSPEEERRAIVEELNGQFKNCGDSSRIPGVLKWPEVSDLQKSGIAIGSHTVNHEFLSSLPSHQVMHELVVSKERLEGHLQTAVKSFSYPGGRFNDEIVAQVKEAGYACAFTTHSGLNTFADDPYTLRRINIWDNIVSSQGRSFSKAITAWALFLRS